jgi:hypothetical protein
MKKTESKTVSRSQNPEHRIRETQYRKQKKEQKNRIQERDLRFVVQFISQLFY